jgi:hypothetical protein
MFWRYVASVSYGCCKNGLGCCISCKVFQRHVASFSEACCKRLFKILYLFQTYVASLFIGILHMFHNMLQWYVVLCCNKCFYVASCKWFIWMLHMFHTHVASVCPNVLSVSDVCCIQVFNVASVACFRCMFRELLGHGPGAVGRGAVSRGPTDGARSAPS